MSRYANYRADWEANNPNIVQPQIVRALPDLNGAQRVAGHRVWDNRGQAYRLANGAVLEVGYSQTGSELYALFPTEQAFDGYRKPLSSNEFYG